MTKQFIILCNDKKILENELLHIQNKDEIIQLISYKKYNKTLDKMFMLLSYHNPSYNQRIKEIQNDWYNNSTTIQLLNYVCDKISNIIYEINMNQFKTHIK